MKKQASILKLGRMVGILLGIAMLPLMSGTAMSASDNLERIPFVLETLKADKMPPVFFSHEAHMAALDDDCSVCHTTSDEYFLDSENQSAKDIALYMHRECVSCHAADEAAKKPTGPLLASCRSCHNPDIAAEQAALADK